MPLTPVLGYGSRSPIRATPFGHLPVGGGDSRTVVVDVYRDEAEARAAIQYKTDRQATLGRGNVVVIFPRQASASNRRTIRSALADLGATG